MKAELDASEERAREQLAKKEAELKRLELGAEVRKTKHHETMRLLGDKKKVRTVNRVRILSFLFCDSLPISEIINFFSVADPGCLSRIRIFSIPDSGSEFFSSRIPDPHQRIFYALENMIRVVQPGSGS